MEFDLGVSVKNYKGEEIKVVEKRRRVIKGKDGNNIGIVTDSVNKKNDDGTDVIFTIRDIVVDALNFEGKSPGGSAINNSPTDKAIIYKISIALFNDDLIELGASDIEFILKKVRSLVSPLNCGRVEEALVIPKE